MKLARGFVLGIFLAAASCERIDVPEKNGAPTLVAEIAALFTQADPRLYVAHQGTRTLELFGADDSVLRFREVIATDGAGRYSIRPLGPAGSTVADWDSFELTQVAREGFLFRYRDFAVRDAQLFRENWLLERLATDANVAGRTCQLYRAERTRGPAAAYELSVDVATGLILASREYDAEDRLVARMTYDDFQTVFDHDAIVWHVPANDERALEPEDELPVAPLEPHLLPDGHAEIELATVAEGSGRRWVKRTYSDGVECAFFFQGLPERVLEKPTRAQVLDSAAPRAPSALVVFQLGPVTVVQGELDGYDLLVLGKQPEAELLDLLESALP
jgi:hypothetical protein